jgi:hypothetical protein
MSIKNNILVGVPCGPCFPLQSVFASAARQSVEHISSQARKAGIFASITNANRITIFELRF